MVLEKLAHSAPMLPGDRGSIWLCSITRGRGAQISRRQVGHWSQKEQRQLSGRHSSWPSCLCLLGTGQGICLPCGVHVRLKPGNSSTLTMTFTQGNLPVSRHPGHTLISSTTLDPPPVPSALKWEGSFQQTHFEREVPYGNSSDSKRIIPEGNKFQEERKSTRNGK